VRRILLAVLAAFCFGLPGSAAPAAFKVLVLAEEGDQHGPFVEAAKAWLESTGKKAHFSFDCIENTEPITAAFLAKYRVVVQLNYAPWGWKPEAEAAFKAYIEEGRGGWVGFHHASLLGDFDGHQQGDWFRGFMGGIRYRDYISTFVSATVRVEDPKHPCMKGLPASFGVPREEWYTYDQSPRGRVRVLATVDESTFAPATDKTMGDHPVVWTNERVKARNIYIFMGHGADHFQNQAFTTLFRNALLWAAGR